MTSQKLSTCAGGWCRVLRALLSEAEDWNFDEEPAQLGVEMKSVVDVFRKDETNKMINGVEVGCSFLALKHTNPS